MDDSVIAPETGLADAISFEKGCYVGQEIVARAHWRGRVNRRLSGFFVQIAELSAGPGRHCFVRRRICGPHNFIRIFTGIGSGRHGIHKARILRAGNSDQNRGRNRGRGGGISAAQTGCLTSACLSDTASRLSQTRNSFRSVFTVSKAVFHCGQTACFFCIIIKD